jgi:heptosyltransferase I
MSKTRPKSLLVIKPSSLGDIVHGLQILQSVTRQLPECRVTWVVRDRFAPLVEAAPFIHETIPFYRKQGFGGLREVMKTLRARQFDAVWDMQGLLRTGLMTAAARSPEKWGRADSREGSGWFCNRRIQRPEGPGPHHAIAVLQGFPKSIGLDPEIEFPLHLHPGPQFPWQSFFAHDPSLNFVIFTDSRGVGKEWPKFDELTQLIWEKIPGSRVAWCAGQPMSPSNPPDGRFLNLTGCPLPEMIELVRQRSIFIGNDSGPMHLSAAVGNPVLAIFGPTSPLRFGPWPIGSPRSQAIQAPAGVLADLSAASVFQRLEELRSRL